MATNFIPFAKRAVVTVPANGRVSTFLSDLSSGGCIKVHLGDMIIDTPRETITIDDQGIPLEYRYACRIGVAGRGYLTESFYPFNLFKDGLYAENGVWHFPKPYRLFPGQRMRAEVVLPSTFTFDARNPDALSYVFMPGIMFNGIKLKDNSPIMLYDRANIADIYAITALPATYLLNRETLQCPADSPIDLYSVTAIPMNDRYWNVYEFPANDPTSPGIMPELMIYGPDDRKWWDQREWPQIVHPPTNFIDLTKPEWVLDPAETLTVEIWDKGPTPPAQGNTNDVPFYVTLRGSLEVTLK